jgi:diguanylate cyclase (GGDEF)-like protein
MALLLDTIYSTIIKAMRTFLKSYSGMSISKKLLFNLLLLFLLLILINLIIGYHQIYLRFASLEQELLRADRVRIQETLDREVLHLDSYTNDWSSWDDTWYFMKTESLEYIDSNLNMDTNIIGKINLMSFIRPDGTILWQMIADLEEEEEIYLKEFPMNRFPADIVMPYQNQAVRGFYVMGDRIIFLAIRTVLKTDQTGPVNGYLAFGRILTDEMLQTLREITYVDFKIYPFDAPPESLSKEEFARLRDKNIIEQRSYKNIVLYSLIDGLNGDTSLILEINHPREIIDKGRLSFIYFFITSLASLLLIGYLVLQFIKKEILKPVNDLFNHMDNIHKTGNLSAHIEVSGNNEFGQLSMGFNDLLKIIEKQTNQLKEQNLTLEEQASRDELTGLFNKRYFNSALKRHCMENINVIEPIAMLMLDIDHFKLYNDVYGHMAGDVCIMSVSKVLREIVTRPTDLAARYGGEEFILFLKETDIEGAFVVGRKIQKSLMELKIENKKSTVSPYLTMSIGISHGEAKTIDDLNTLIEKADKALYRSKEEGRNRISVG